MQKAVRVNECQLLQLSSKARSASTVCGFLHKRSADTGRWQQRFFVLYQNLLIYFESDRSDRPSCVTLLEACYCDRHLTLKTTDKDKQQQLAHCFSIFLKKDGQRHLDLRAESEADCDAWVQAITSCSYSKLQESREQLQQKHLHLLQIQETERQSKWNYVQQTEELSAEVAKLRQEVRELKDARRSRTLSVEHSEETEEIRKIKKVQSFFRGWLCRRRWKQIVDEYIRSEHADHMRRRNAIVFGLVECEEEYVQQLSILVTCFLRPFRMAASAKKPIISHDDVNSIFLNAETLLFLHQIFLQGLNSKMDNWPTMQLGDLFDMLLPMLGIYQEYVRNHHYSLQVLAEYKQKPEFSALLKRYEEKSMCEARSLETFLTYPMHQIPRYIVTLHQLLAHTPHDHVDRQQLEFARGKLENLSHVMHDEVSETENIRKNLAIERTIVEGCDILLDANQIFVRQGFLTQYLGADRPKNARQKLGSFSTNFTKDSRKEAVHQAFLFTNHLILTNRRSNGRLHLAKNFSKIPLADCTLAEDSAADLFFYEDDELAEQQHQQQLSLPAAEQVHADAKPEFNGLDFRLIVDMKSGPPATLTFVANSVQEKAAWCSDINQCIEQIHYSDLLNSTLAETSSVSMPHTMRSDPKLYKDDIDIKFSRTMNSCKVPQIRHASVQRLLDRLTDLRFLSIDFLNTFLLTYRIFTDPKTVIAALKRVLTNPELGNLDSRAAAQSSEESEANSSCASAAPDKERRISEPGMVRMSEPGVLRMQSEAGGTQPQAPGPQRTRSLDASATEHQHQQHQHQHQHQQHQHQHQHELSAVDEFYSSAAPADAQEVLHELSDIADRRRLAEAPELAPIASCEILADDPSARSHEHLQHRDALSAKKVRILGVTESEVQDSSSPQHAAAAAPPAQSHLASPGPCRRALPPSVPLGSSAISHSASSPTVNQQQPHSSHRASVASWSGGKRPSCAESAHSDATGAASRSSLPRSDFEPSPCRGRAGAVVTSSRASKRRSSNTAAALAFAAATAGATKAGNLGDALQKPRQPEGCLLEKRFSVICTAATMRVLNVVRHWVYKFGEDIEGDQQLREDMTSLLEELVCNQSLFPPDHKAALQILLRLRDGSLTQQRPDLQRLLAPSVSPSPENFDTLSALDIAEQLTLIDSHILRAIRSEELLMQAWMKRSKEGRVSTVNMVSRRFNEVSRLVISEIVSRGEASERATCIEKWAAIADICRCLHNFNGVLQICAGLVNSSVFRLKKTWEKVPKSTRQLIDKLQHLVSSDCRFKNMRAELHSCEAPCIPYLGMYLTDLSFIEEGTSNVTEKGLVNFCKMRMIAHVIREIQEFQQTPYGISHNQRVCDYLLDTSRHVDDEQAYQASLKLEPRLSICPDARVRQQQQE